MKVKPGQIWSDNDPRTPRKFKILVVGTSKALCENVDLKRKTRIRLDRFRPGRTGYTLLYDV